MNKVKTIIDIYNEVLEGKRKSFPHDTWNPYKSGYDNFNRCFRYIVIDTLKYDRQMLLNHANQSFFRKYKLRGGISILFNDSPYNAICSAFPEFKIHFWELSQVPNQSWTRESIIEATRWLFNEKLKWTREDMISNNISYDIFRQNNLGKLIKGERFGFKGIYGLINMSFPEYNLKIWDFREIKSWTTDDIYDGLKNFFENVLNWSIDDIKSKL